MQRIYDTKQQKIVDFVPLKTDEVGMYVCGPTVQSAPHIGHLRSALAYDIIRRWFLAQGLKVTFIRNVTDIDDKILAGAKASEDTANPEEWWALAYRVEREFTHAYDALGVLPPTYEPRATANIAQMHDLIATLIARGHAYEDELEPGNVYFDTNSWPEYGSLTRQNPKEMEPAEDGNLRGKKDKADFALWKALKADEPVSASWDSPWGRGRPGWHIECSAMAKRYLGDSFDIHGGGLDLRFPHHENEMAQSNAAGDDFARHWIHNGLVNTQGQKMSKSLGNSLFAHELLAEADPLVLRYFLIGAHYRSVLEYTDQSLQEAESAFGRIIGVLKRLEELDLMPTETTSGATAEATAEASEKTDSGLDPQAFDVLPEGFRAAMFDDFATPEALAEVHGTVTELNTAIDAKDSTQKITELAGSLLAMLNVLGLNPLETETDTAGQNTGAALTVLVEQLLADRAAARENKDFKTSDEIRDRLAEAGISIKDHSSGTHWGVK